MSYLDVEREYSFEKEILAELLTGSFDTDDPLDYLLDEFRGSVKAFLESALTAERDMFLGFDVYERGIGKQDMRNGYYERDIESVFGLIEDLRIPRTRSNTFRTRLIAKYQRRQKQVATLIREMFVRGISTRRVAQVLTPLLGIEPSAQTVSRIAKTLDAEVTRYRRRQLSDDFIYLFLDGVNMKVKEAPHAVTKTVLCAYGIKRDGRRELIDFRCAGSESETNWATFLGNMQERGLLGDNLQMIVTDGGAGMIKAVEAVYPYTPRQRCWAHKARNVANKVRKRNLEECMSGLRRIYTRSSRQEAIVAYRDWAARWREEEPEAVACVAKDLEELLTFYKMPRDHWKKIRTTNLIERIFREVRRRTRPIDAFANKESCDRIVFAVFKAFNDRWESCPIRHFTQKS